MKTFNHFSLTEAQRHGGEDDRELGIRNYELRIPNLPKIPNSRFLIPNFSSVLPCLCEKKDLKGSLTEAQRHGGEDDRELGIRNYELRIPNLSKIPNSQFLIPNSSSVPPCLCEKLVHNKVS